MSTAEMVHQAGAWSVACVLLLALAVIVLRLLALPFAVTAIVLDKAAVAVARRLTFTTRPDWRARR